MQLLQIVQNKNGHKMLWFLAAFPDCLKHFPDCENKNGHKMFWFLADFSNCLKLFATVGEAKCGHFELVR